MIKLLRVDDRLIHGQVAVSWTSFLGVDTIVVANDHAIEDKLMQMAFQMAKPPQVTLSVKSLDGAAAVINNPKHAARVIFVVTASVQDAFYLMERCDSISEVCLGGMRKAPDKKMVERQVYLDQEDMEAIEKIHAMGKDVFLQAVPTEKKLLYDDIVKEFHR
ncbi:PTS sugar transporter subunit IIB [Clostridium sp. Marseille-P2415]|uniref:PTS sugar transporter subunit IIB n=1 Tax=Clostridium sp. Marseille-P2415 TaxID=1805471 RepID=UPI0009887866|nr:PTS sugar transporter subunit IIB [Clostridium sp. Marseille-P2415]